MHKKCLRLIATITLSFLLTLGIASNLGAKEDPDTGMPADTDTLENRGPGGMDVPTETLKKAVTTPAPTPTPKPEKK